MRVEGGADFCFDFWSISIFYLYRRCMFSHCQFATLNLIKSQSFHFERCHACQ